MLVCDAGINEKCKPSFCVSSLLQLKKNIAEKSEQYFTAFDINIAD